jgi:hypothetical protein
MNEILKIPFAAFNNNWDDLQLFLKHRGNPPYEITDNLDLRFSGIQSLGNLTSVGGDLDLGKTPLSREYSEDEIRSMVEVGGKVYL